MEMSKKQIAVLMDYLESLDRYGIRQLNDTFDKQNDIVSKNLSFRLSQLCELLKINKPNSFDLSEKISSSYDLIKWLYKVPIKKFSNRQNKIITDSIKTNNINKMSLAESLDHNIVDKDLSTELGELEKKVCSIVIDRVCYLFASSNLNNQNYIYFKDKVEAMIESEVELNTKKLCENYRELYSLLKKKIRSSTDIVCHNVRSFLDTKSNFYK